MAGRTSSSERIVLLVAAPTRSYAAALTAAGIVSRASSSGRAPDPETHFWNVIAPLDGDLPAPVKVLTDEGKIVETVLKEIEFDDRGGGGRLRARIQWFKDQVRFVYWDRSLSLLPVKNADYEERKLLRRHSVEHHSEFVEALPWVESAAQYAFRSDAICDICGHASHLEPSFQDVAFALPTADGGTARGSIQDVVRVDRWTGKGEGHRARLVLPSASVEDDSFEQAQAVVFNGARPYLKLEQHWPSSDQVILLAHHERSAPQVADRLKRQLVQAQGRVDLISPEDVPRGVEMMALTEKKLND